MKRSRKSPDVGRFSSAVDEGNAAGERVTEASKRFAELVEQLASACDDLNDAREISQRREILSDEVKEAEPTFARLRALVDFLAAERDQQIRRSESRAAMEESARRAEAKPWIDERAAEIVALPRGEWHDALAGADRELETRVSELVAERIRAETERVRAALPAATREEFEELLAELPAWLSTHVRRALGLGMPRAVPRASRSRAAVSSS